MAELLEDILAPLVRHLRKDSVLQELQTLIPAGGMNPVLGPPNLLLREGQMVPYEGDPAPWIFRGFTDTGEPFAHVEGTGSCAITLEYITDWTRGVRGKSLIFPVIDVYYYCDPTREELGYPAKYDAKDKCLTLHKRVREIFNIRDKGVGGFLEWGAKDDGSGALKVVSSVPGTPLRAVPKIDGDGLITGKASFELEVFI